MKSIACWLLSLVALLPLCANNNLRHWNLTDGSRVHAELVEFDETEDQVYLRVNEADDLYLELEDFSPLDQAWLVEWTRMSAQLMEMLDKMPGAFTAYQYQGELDTHDFYVYEPSSVKGTNTRPIMFLFSAGPKGMRYLLRHIEAAEATGMTIITMDRFGNSHTAEAADRNLELNNDIEVGIIAFEGGHQVPPVEHQVMAFEWLLDSGAVETLSTLDDLRPPTPPTFSQ